MSNKTHSISDNDTHFSIDAESRQVTNNAKYIKLMQYDHNSEIFTFEIPRYVEGHDMLLCDHVQIHYCNNGKDSYVNDYYEVTDLRIKPGTENTLIFTWLVGWSATSKEGTLDFTIRFMCTTGEESDYVWNTRMYTGIPIESSVYSTDKIIEQNTDAFNSILARVNEVENKAESSETKVGQFDERITALENKPSGETCNVLEIICRDFGNHSTTTDWRFDGIYMKDGTQRTVVLSRENFYSDNLSVKKSCAKLVAEKALECIRKGIPIVFGFSETTAVNTPYSAEESYQSAIINASIITDSNYDPMVGPTSDNMHGIFVASTQLYNGDTHLPDRSKTLVFKMVDGVSESNSEFSVSVYNLN